jgi:peroxiredoxin
MKHKLLLSLLLCAGAAWGDDKPAPIAPPTAGVKIANYPAVRVGDIAPEIALPLPDKTLWTLREQRGKKPVLLVLTAEEPILVSERATQAEALVAILEAAGDLKKAGVETALISKAIGVNLGAINPETGLIGLRDENGALAKLFNVGQTAITLVAIDRAGFIRSIDNIRDVADVAPRMMKLGSRTPEVEIGKPAPDFSIADANGTVRRLSDLRGQKNLLLTFFPKCFTGG